MRTIGAAEQRVIEEAAARAGVPAGVLMERAGGALAERIMSLLAERGGGPVSILCGPGNNGGDGFVAARLLREAGASVTVGLLGDRAALAGDAADAAARCREALAIVDAASGADHPDSLPALVCLATALAEGHPREAAPLLDRAARLGVDDDTGETAAAITAARARVALGAGDRRGAARLAAAAVAAYDGVGASAATARGAVIAWMRRRGIASP